MKKYPAWNLSGFERYGSVALTGAPIRFEEYTAALNKHFSISAYCPAKGQFACVFQDITETKRLQELESRAERLESAGTIAGQVAHDFNNLLAPLIAYPDFIRESLPRDHASLDYLNEMENSAIKIADINQQLLTLGRRGHYTQETINLNTIVHQVVREMGSLPRTIAYELKLDDNIMNITGGSAQIHRLISNLLYNAHDSMNSIGQLTIKTENYYVDEVSVAYGCVPKGEFVKLTIKDTGCGIPEEILQKIFDPFFTSKTTDKKRGSGLGLSVVDAVIKDHHGFIDLSSKVGQGTSFFVYIPATRKSIDEEGLEGIERGNESILIVDDDEVQRNVTSALLGNLGYKVSLAESGEAAVMFLENKSQDLLILDMIMPPGIDGTET